MVDLSFSMADLEYFLLIFVRIASFVFVAPFFNTRGVPNNIKIALSFFVAYVMYVSLDIKNYPEYNTLLGYASVVLKEVTVGLLIGFVTQLCTSIVLFAGRIMDMEIGLSMANVFDPTTNQQASISGVALQYGVTLILYTTGLHRYLLKALMETYILIPVGGAKFNIEKILPILIEFLASYIVIGFRICLPVFASITIMNIVLGLLAKIAPQMNMFTVGIQLKLLLGLAVLLITVGMLPDISNFISTQIRQIIVSVVEAIM